MKPTTLLLALVLFSAPLALGEVAAISPASASLDGVACQATPEMIDGLDPLEGAQNASLCPDNFCSNESDCEFACPSATSSYCSNWSCVFNQGDDPPPGGGICPSLCSTDANCENACPGLDVYCASNLCYIR